MKRLFSCLLGLAFCGLTGCSGLGGKPASVSAEQLSGKSLRATAFGRFEDGGNVSVNQHWLMAQQTAKLAAYRGLADQLYKEILDGEKTVGSQVMSDEAFRVYVDTYLREAHATDYRTVKDTLRITLELNLTPRFYRCMSGDAVVVNQCLQEDNKLALTRLGSKPATRASANLACGGGDCSDQYYVQGFSKDRNMLDNVLLDAGLYDGEWAAHSSLSLLERLMLFKAIVNGF